MDFCPEIQMEIFLVRFQINIFSLSVCKLTGTVVTKQPQMMMNFYQHFQHV